ncbi:MAG: UbiD family decarboxylase [Anaerolineales bacterium]|nr:UbiD family decarboxylase [Anaerolineales bacterium]
MTTIHNLRSFIEILEAAGQLVRIKQPVSLTHELADVAATLERSGGGAPLFENVTGSLWPIFAGGVANQKRAALALGCSEKEVTDVMGRALDPKNGIAPVRVADAPWQANVQTGASVDARTLPIPTHSRGDGGPFITGGVIVSRDPVSGRGNLSYNRMLCTGRPASVLMSTSGGTSAPLWKAGPTRSRRSPSPLPSGWTRRL